MKTASVFKKGERLSGARYCYTFLSPTLQNVVLQMITIPQHKGQTELVETVWVNYGVVEGAKQDLSSA